jgi:hypothetical protein
MVHLLSLCDSFSLQGCSIALARISKVIMSIDSSTAPTLTILLGIDSSLADNLGRTFSYLLNVITVFTTITYIGGWQFLVAAAIIGSLYYNSASVRGLPSLSLNCNSTGCSYMPKRLGTCGV